jgi:hypothetical protein
MDRLSECGVVGLCINLMQSIMLRTMYELCPMYELRTMYHMNGHNHSHRDHLFWIGIRIDAVRKTGRCLGRVPAVMGR